MRVRDVSELLTACDLQTPALVYDESEIRRASQDLRSLCDLAGCHPLFALKACGLTRLLAFMFPALSGVSVSSLYEARSAREALGEAPSLHLTTPGLVAAQARELAALCDFVSFNSLNQFSRCAAAMAGQAKLGLRINPEHSHVADPRYDPCRAHSKLGVPLSELERLLDGDRALMSDLSGLHLHSNCESADLTELQDVMAKLLRRIPDCLAGLEWINLGGGYLYESQTSTEAFLETVTSIRERNPEVGVFVEPGAALVRNAGYLVASVIDLFQNRDRTIAILDTTVNHAPEVFEYGYEPDAHGDDDKAPWTYILAGSSCLAGDVFGHYGFARPLEIGSRIVFQEMGAYTLVKAHSFNGIPLPSVVVLTTAGRLEPVFDASYHDYARQWGGTSIEAY